jgi:hypothetical protein
MPPQPKGVNASACAAAVKRALGDVSAAEDKPEWSQASDDTDGGGSDQSTLQAAFAVALVDATANPRPQ